jgi:serine/threonine-protein kinase
VAIKAVRLPEQPETETEEEIARFRREAQAAGRLTHPNIVGVYDYGETSDLAYIVMEFVDGTTLKYLLDRQERFAVADIDRIMQDILSGLQYSHARGVVHRDIKPANIMLTSTGQAKITDFGIARIESSSMTQAGTVLGTPAYMSPEQFTGQVVTAHTDIYSAGVLLYQLLTGEKPFEGSVTAIMHKVLNTDPPLPSRLAVTSPVAMDAVVHRAMSKRPEDRFPSASAFAEAIAAAVAAPSAPARSGPEAEATVVSGPGRPAPAAAAAHAAPRSVTRRSPFPLLIAAVVAGIAVLATGGWWFMRHPTPPAVSAVVQQSATEATSPASQLARQPPAPAPSEQAATAASAQQAATAPSPAPLPNATASTSPAASPVSPAAPPTNEAAPATPQSAPASNAATKAPPAAAPTSPRAPSTAPQAAPEATESATPPPPADHFAATQPKAAPPPAPPQAVASPASPSGGSIATSTPEQVAAIGLGSLRTQIERLLASTPCTLVDSTVQDSGTVTVAGLAGRPADDAVHRKITDIAGSHALDWRVQRIEPVFCDALTAVRPVAPLAGAPDRGLRLTLSGDRTALHEGEFIQPRVTMPDFSGRLRVDYLAHDGSLAHLYPTVADTQQHFVAVPSRLLRPGEVLEIGRPGAGHPQWEVAPPFGTDMIIAVASSVPLLNSAPAQNFEDNGADYIRRLGRAIEAAENRGASITGTVMLVDTLPK